MLDFCFPPDSESAGDSDHMTGSDPDPNPNPNADPISDFNPVPHPDPNCGHHSPDRK